MRFKDEQVVWDYEILLKYDTLHFDIFNELFYRFFLVLLFGNTSMKWKFIKFHIISTTMLIVIVHLKYCQSDMK